MGPSVGDIGVCAKHRGMMTSWASNQQSLKVSKSTNEEKPEIMSAKMKG